MKHLPIIGLLAAFAVPAIALDYSEPKHGGPKQMFEQLDANKNGVVTHAEFMQHSAARFSEFDADADGFLTLQELPETMPLPPVAQKRMERRQERMQKRMEHQGVDADIAEIDETPERARRLRFMARLDKNGDERLSVEEFAAPPLKRFKFADVNGDGQVTESELNTAMSERAQRPHPRRTR